MSILISAVWVVLFLALILSNIWLIWTTAWKVRDHYKNGVEVATRSLLSVFKWRFVGILVLGLSTYYTVSTWRNYAETETRRAPTATVQTSDRRNNEVPFVSVTNGPTWEQRMATNKAQNAAARTEFDKLPSKQ